VERQARGLRLSDATGSVPAGHGAEGLLRAFADGALAGVRRAAGGPGHAAGGDRGTRPVAARDASLSPARERARLARGAMTKRPARGMERAGRPFRLRPEGRRLLSASQDVDVEANFGEVPTQSREARDVVARTGRVDAQVPEALARRDADVVHEEHLG